MPRRAAFSVLFSLTLMAAPLRAEPSEADRATARALAAEGYRALQAKNYETAADRFRRADALVHAPTLVVDHARALVGLGRLVEAHERYELVLREGVEPKAPRSWHKALESANKELEALKPRLAWVTIQVQGVPEPTVTIDDSPVPGAALGVRRAIDPGTRTIRVSADGFLSAERTLNLSEGEEQTLEIELAVDPSADAPSAPPEPPAPAPVVPERGSSAPLYVAFGVAGAGLLVGGVTGALALGKRAELEKVCTGDGRCPSAASDDLDAYRRFGWISGIGLGVGVAAAATGLTLLVTRPKASAAWRTAPAVQPVIGVLSVGAVGRF
jgi:hypothetical protein